MSRRRVESLRFALHITTHSMNVIHIRLFLSGHQSGLEYLDVVRLAAVRVPHSCHDFLSSLNIPPSFCATLDEFKGSKATTRRVLRLPEWNRLDRSRPHHRRSHTTCSTPTSFPIYYQTTSIDYSFHRKPQIGMHFILFHWCRSHSVIHVSHCA